MFEGFIAALILMAVAGLLVGFIAALLGIGGGMLMVPALFFIFIMLDVPEGERMHVAAGTSLFVMIATSVGSGYSHMREKNVVWEITRRILPGIVIGVVVGAIFAAMLKSQTLAIIFAIVLVAIAVLMVFGFKATPSARPLPRLFSASAFGCLVGFKSGLLGIGGGALSVPWLTWLGLPQNEVSGTSATFTFPAAVVGTVAFMITGFSLINMDYTIGYVFWPALPVAGTTSICGTFFGVRLVRRVPGHVLRVLFGVILFGVAISMVLTK